MQVEITFLPENKKTLVRAGTTLLDAARRAKVHIRTRCGGKAACLMCKVHVATNEGLMPHTTAEALKLGELRGEGIRLACQARVRGDSSVVITLPEDPLKAAIRKQLARQEQEDELW